MSIRTQNCLPIRTRKQLGLWWYYSHCGLELKLFIIKTQSIMSWKHNIPQRNQFVYLKNHFACRQKLEVQLTTRRGEFLSRMADNRYIRLNKRLYVKRMQMTIAIRVHFYPSHWSVTRNRYHNKVL